MNVKIPIRFKVLSLISTLGWAILLLLSLFIRGLLSETVFYVIVIILSILFTIDIILLISRLIEGNYILITKEKVQLKRFMKPIKFLWISELTSITVSKKQSRQPSIILSNGKDSLEIKHRYKASKKNILSYIQQSDHFPKDLMVVYEDNAVV